MLRRPLCPGGPDVAPLGFGAGHIGGGELTEDEAGTILNRALDRGVNLIDTARGYGLSEERIGRHVAWRRDDAVLVSKCGYGIDGHADWTAGCIRAGIDEALRRMRTDRIDAMLLHSCPRAVLERGEVVGALEDGVRAGKLRFIGYSGENDDLAYAVESGRFRVVEASVNICDQRTLDRADDLARRGIGLIAKRPLANAPWRFARRPEGDYAEAYWLRLEAMELPPSSLPMDERALRFAAYAPGVAVAIAGTRSVANLERNVAIVEAGPLPAPQHAALRQAFRAADQGWSGQL